MPRSYREDIDWLRAIAVISVLAFHWDIPPFRGGFVGVDIFFVISGFLITQIIQSEMASGEFSFARFYERRVRRLLPALYVTVVLVAIPSFYYLLPSERHEFFKSVAAVVTFTSNVFFWLQSGYFDRAADEKPLLHTWSLSVEEQFYLLLPLLVWGLLRWQGRATGHLKLTSGLVVATLASFGLSYVLMRDGQSAAAFFLSPPRAWEFLAGSLVAIEGVPVLRNVHLQRLARIVGLVIMSADWTGYARGMGFDAMMDIVRGSIAALRDAGVKVAIVGPSIQFRSALPSMLVRAQIRKIDPLPLDDLLQPAIFDVDAKMKAALAGEAGVPFVSVLDNVCAAQKCPVTLPGDVPLAWDHAHLTSEGSAYVASRLAPLLDLPLKRN